MLNSGDGRVIENMENVILEGIGGGHNADGNDVTKKPDVDVESMLFHAGDFGRYQILLLVLFSIVNILSAFHYFAQTLITVQPTDFKCLNTDDFPNNFTNIDDQLTDLKFNESESIIDHANETCKRYYLDVTEIVNQDRKTIERKSVWNYEDCKSFVYERDFGYESIITEFDWVCKNSWKSAVGESMYFVGAVVGTFFLGIASDKWGRLKSLIIAYIIGAIGNASTVLSNDFEPFAASRFIAGLATDTTFVMMYIIVMEYVKPSMRTFGLNICMGIFYCLGCSIGPWLAVALKTWRTFLTTIAGSMLIVPFYYFILPESASWLLAQGEADKALDSYLRIAKINGKIISQDVIKRFKEVYNAAEKPSEARIYELFKTRRLRRKMLILIFKTMTLTLCYDTISRNIRVNGVSSFLIFSIGSLTIFLASIVIVLIQDKIGRKPLFFIAVLSSAILTTTSGLMNAFLKDTSTATSEGTTLIYTSVGLSVAARLCVVIAFNSGSQYAAELIPTVIRGRGVALIHVVGYAASFLSPLLLYLGRFWLSLPDLVLGTLCFISACATLLLPETLGKILPVTIEDGEIFGEDEKPWDFIVNCFNGKKNPDLSRDNQRDT